MKNEAKRIIEVAKKLNPDKIWIPRVVKYGCEAYLRLGADFKTPIHKWLMEFRDEKYMWNSSPITRIDYSNCDESFVTTVRQVFRKSETGQAPPSEELIVWIYRNIVFAAQVGSIGYGPDRRREYAVGAGELGFYMGGCWTFKHMKCNNFNAPRPEQPIKI